MSNRKPLLCAIAIAIAIAAAIPLISYANRVRLGSASSSAPHEFGIDTEAKALAADDLEVLALEVRPSGFIASETTVTAGKFLILIRNRTGRRDLTFWLSRENEARISESDPQKRDWKAVVQLSPGTYILGETNHPEWKSIIRVVAR